MSGRIGAKVGDCVGLRIEQALSPVVRVTFLLPSSISTRRRFLAISLNRLPG